MKVKARDIMTPRFYTLSPDMPLPEVIDVFRNADRKEGRRIFGMMVVDEDGRLSGMLSMYDILLYMKPKHIHIWGEMEDIEVKGVVENACRRMKTLVAGDLMTRDVVTIDPDTHLMVILDIMIKKHIRRLPVVEKGTILGIVYISDLFYHLLERFEGQE